MNSAFRKIVPCFFSLFFTINTTGEVLTDSTFNPNIHTIQIFKEGWELSYPVIMLNASNKLRVSFDDFNTNIKNYCYTIIHCNSNWEPTNLSYSEYVDGFEQNQITSHLFSINTVIGYIHYSFNIPNENCNPRISGNYIVKVFDNFDESKILFTKKFYIVESSANIDFTIMRPEVAKYMARNQQYKIHITPNLNDYSDLRSEIKTYIYQNYNENSRKECYISRLDELPSLYYDDPDSNLFAGGNEYRNFDLKSKKYQSEHIKNIKYDSSGYAVNLYDDEWRNKKQYFSEVDLNGNYFIQNTLGTAKDVDADYFWIKFSLTTPEPLIDGDIYVFGGLTNWQCNTLSKMIYNYDKTCYELKLLLKQGYYNYQYAFKSKDGNKYDLSIVERDHYETENDYLIFVYYKSAAARYERLIGYKIANSVKKTE